VEILVADKAGFLPTETQLQQRLSPYEGRPELGFSMKYVCVEKERPDYNASGVGRNFLAIRTSSPLP
jgi:hypothetical protein